MINPKVATVVDVIYDRRPPAPLGFLKGSFFSTKEREGWPKRANAGPVGGFF
jgi:hypothetical protein